MSKESKHHFLIVGEVVFRMPNEEEVRAAKVNGVLVTDSRNVGSAHLGKCQQIVQLHFRQSLPDPKIQVVDVVLLNIDYLGEMTEEEFLGPNAVQEQPEAKPAPVIQAVPDLDEAVRTASKPDA